MIACDAYQYWTSAIVHYAEWVPWVYALGLFVAYSITSEPAYSYVGWFITFISLPIYPAQAYFDYEFVDPFCGLFALWMFPHFGSICSGSLLFLLIMFIWWYKAPFNWFQIFLIVLVLIVPALANIWKHSLEVWMIFASAGYGILLAVLFFAILWNSKDSFPYVFNIPIYCNWVNESILLRDEQSRLKYRQLKRWREDRERSLRQSTSRWASLSWLSSRYGQIKSQLTPQDSLSGTSDSSSSQTTFHDGAQTSSSMSYLLSRLYGSHSSVFQIDKAP